MNFYPHSNYLKIDQKLSKFLIDRSNKLRFPYYVEQSNKISSALAPKRLNLHIAIIQGMILQSAKTKE